MIFMLSFLILVEKSIVQLRKYFSHDVAIHQRNNNTSSTNANANATNTNINIIITFNNNNNHNHNHRETTTTAKLGAALAQFTLETLLNLVPTWHSVQSQNRSYKLVGRKPRKKTNLKTKTLVLAAHIWKRMCPVRTNNSGILKLGEPQVTMGFTIKMVWWLLHQDLAVARRCGAGGNGHGSMLPMPMLLGLNGGSTRKEKLLKISYMLGYHRRLYLPLFLIFIDLLDQMITHSRETNGTIMFQKDSAGIKW